MLSEPLDLSTPTYNEDGEEETKPVIQKALRDVFIQSQTGSGKTLTYLLPIIQTLLPLSKLSHIDRSIGTLAIILAPTRELAQQIEKVLDQVLSMALSLPDSDITDERYTRWLVSGLLVGGSTRTHEKAKLRKGVPILVATPGRLLDHLQNTASFQCAKTMFLVLDEADRVMDLGFEETIQGIIKALDGRRRLEIAAEKEMDEVGGGTMRWPFWGRGRRTILCSATVDSKVQKLAGVALQDPILFKGTDDKPKDADSKVKEATSYDPTAIELPQTNLEKFTPPSQLSQKYVVVPTKLRLVALVALIRSFVASATEGGNKIIVFLSSTDAVDFLWKMLGGIRMDRDDNVTASKDASAVTLQSPLFPNTNLQRLHGSLPLQTRRSSLAAFAAASKSPSVLFATSVASRGLDLPLVRAVIQYDLPTEGGANEYVHRVGRTARAGKGGEAWAMVAPNETGWVKWVEGKMGAVGEKEVKLGQAGVEEVLKKGFGGKGYEYEARATQAQLAFERWVTDDEQVSNALLHAWSDSANVTQNAAMSRKAFASFVRAYSTHPLEEKVFFHPKSLHLGHLAKAFALREAPSVMAGMTKASAKTAATAASTKQPAKKRKREDGEEGASSDGSDDDEPAAKGGKESTARNETERRMYEAVRKAGRAVKSGGALGEFDKKVRGVNGRKPTAMASSGGGEFQVMGGDEIERIVSGKRR
jgi:ATP-dependent RNA helicase DDX31/DBP7